MLQIGLFVNGRLIDSIDVINDATGSEHDANYRVHYETTKGEDKVYEHKGHDRDRGPWVLARDILNEIMKDGSLNGRKDHYELRKLVFALAQEADDARRKDKG